MSLSKWLGINSHTVNAATLFGVGLAVVALRKDFLWSFWTQYVMVVGGFWFIFLGIAEFDEALKENFRNKPQ